MGRQAFLGARILCFDSRECKRRNDFEIYSGTGRERQAGGRKKVGEPSLGGNQ